MLWDGESYRIYPTRPRAFFEIFLERCKFFLKFYRSVNQKSEEYSGKKQKNTADARGIGSAGTNSNVVSFNGFLRKRRAFATVT